ncbi:MAG: UDP-glucose/GDP-mannose dehydrogenase family protein [Actinomycetota bacterium]|nr:UDP-glucose/GDP-mannose dehydrogenase family protein [Actinomycetota bacterium]
MSTGAAIAVVGAGYVGLPTAGVLARFGHRVVCAERDPGRFDALASGRVPIVEEGLAELLSEGVASGRLRFVRSAAEAVRGARYVFLCVATPEGDHGSADLSFVEAVAREIAETLEPGAIVVNKSTVPVGTALAVERVTGATVVSNPEFLREGTAVADSLRPDRVVVGGDDARAARLVGELFSETGAPLIVTDTVTAETIKYASNAFLATKLSFVNALAGLCEAVGADVRDVVLGLGYDARIGFDFLRPGPGWGGSCLPKDTAALLHISEEAEYDFPLLREAIAANEAARARVVRKVVRAAGGDLAGATVGVWGLTFKAGTDDRRGSPAVAIARRLLELGARVRAYDPTVGPGAACEDLGGMTLCASAYDACREARVVALLTEWDELRGLDFPKVADLMAQPSMVDARNLLDPAALRRCGFAYTGVGRR